MGMEKLMLILVFLGVLVAIVFFFVYLWAGRNDRPEIQSAILEGIVFFLSNWKWILPVGGLVLVVLREATLRSFIAQEMGDMGYTEIRLSEWRQVKTCSCMTMEMTETGISNLIISAKTCRFAAKNSNGNVRGIVCAKNIFNGITLCAIEVLPPKGETQFELPKVNLPVVPEDTER